MSQQTVPCIVRNCAVLINSVFIYFGTGVHNHKKKCPQRKACAFRIIEVKDPIKLFFSIFIIPILMP